MLSKKVDFNIRNKIEYSQGQRNGKESEMRAIGYQIKLKAKEKQALKQMLRKGTERARKLTRGRILLLSDQGKSQKEIIESLSITANTIRTICYRYIKGGLELALEERPRSGAPTIFTGRHKAKITALACSKSPEGRSRWSLRLLADKAVELKLVKTVSHTEVDRILKKTKSSRT